MVVVSITYDSDSNPGVARTFENREDAHLFAESFIRNSSYKGTPAINIAVV